MRFYIISIASVAISLIACDAEDTGGNVGGGYVAGTSASTGAVDGGDVVPLIECITSTKVDGLTLVVAAPANAACEIHGHVGRCDGTGVCAETECETAADCGASNGCFSVSCQLSVTSAHVCQWAEIKDSPCAGVCATATEGNLFDACVALDRVAIYCDRVGGPPILPPVGPSECMRPDPESHPFEYCCKY
jgi:hypothetical protein